MGEDDQMAAIGGMRPDESGVSTLSDFDVPRYEDLDSVDSAVGRELSGLVGRRLDSVYVVFDANDEGPDVWEFDAPTILRFGGLDVAVESVSGLFLSVAFGRAPIGSPLRMYPPDGGANDEINSWYDLSWREYNPASDAFGRVVERVYWRADDCFHPLALGLRLEGGVHLRVGDGGDDTIPELVDPLVVNEATEFDDVVLPAGYRKPASLAPSVVSAEWLRILNRNGVGVRFLMLEGRLRDGELCHRPLADRRLFVGGIELGFAVPEYTPHREGPDEVAVFIGPDELPDGFFVGKRIQIV